MLAAALCLTSALFQDPAPVLVVDPGPIDRRDVPATVELAVGEHVGLADAVALLEGHARVVLREIGTKATIPAQVRLTATADAAGDAADVSPQPTGIELLFVVESMTAGKPRRFRIAVEAGPVEPLFRFDGDGAERRLLAGDRAVLEHDTTFDIARLEATNKPILHLFDAAGRGRITKGAGGEFSHHRGVFFGWNRTKVDGQKYDLWHCGNASQRHAGYRADQELAGPVAARVVASTQWLAADDSLLAHDLRQVTVWRQSAGRTLLDFDLAVESDRKLELRGDPQHAGFQFRAVNEVAENRETNRYVRPHTAADQGNDVWTDCPWVAGIFRIGGRRVAVLHMSHPDNTGPVSYSTRDYGRFGASFEADVRPDKPLRLRYRLLVIDVTDDTDLSVERFARDYGSFVEPVRVRIE